MKMLVIGLDGAGFEVMNPWIKQGRLPNLARLIREGASCRLKSTWPYTTSPAWPAMTTGMSPGDLGLYDFVRPEGYGKRVISRLEIPYTALWDILSKEGKKVVVVGVPMTYPPPKVNGAMVAGFLSPTGRNNGQPLDLLDRFPKLRVLSHFTQRAENLVHRAEEVCDGTLELFREYGPEVAMVVFMETDWAMHFNWGKPSVVRSVFEKVDAQVGRLVSETGAENVVIVSDHGFRPATKLVNVNKILADAGFVADGEDLSEMYLDVHYLRDHQGRSTDAAPRRLSWLGVAGLRLGRWVMKNLSGTLADIGRFSRYFSHKKMDGKGYPLTGIGRFNWEKTKAYLCSPCGMTINVNLQGREPKGAVARDDFERVRTDVIAALEEWKDPDTGQTVFEWVRRPEEIYTGKRVHLAPDIFFGLAPGLHAVAMRFGRPVWKVRGAGQHSPWGIFIARGGMFREAELEEMQITDVLPTLLAGLGVPAPREFDGRVVGDVLSR